MYHRYIILFDGECNLCNASVRFVIKHDKKALFSFTHMQTGRAKSLISQYGIDMPAPDSVVLIKDNTPYLRSSAVFEIIKDLDGMWPFLRVFDLLPSAFNDFLYRYIAKKRYTIFGRSNTCTMPSAEISSRFLKD